METVNVLNEQLGDRKSREWMSKWYKMTIFGKTINNHQNAILAPQK